jgi:phosphatidylinositol alpha-mannosyltransferase
MVDIAALRAGGRAGRPACAPTVVFVGALVHRKGPDLLVRAVLRLRRRGSPVTLTMAGEGPMRGRLERMVRAEKAGSAIRFVGEVGEPLKAELLGTADIACFPSRYGESFGIVLLEGIAAGAGVVLAGENRAYSELFSACPEAVCETSEVALSDRLEKLLDPSARGPLRTAQERLLLRYGIEEVTDQVVGVYRQALRARLGRAGAATPRASANPVLA